MTDCAPCAHADEHGSWVEVIPGLTHCRRCHGTWPMASELQHCTACCRTFTRPSSADVHRGHGGECLDPAAILDKQGRARLAVSSRDWRAGTTVTVWAAADHRTEAPERMRAADSGASTARQGET